MTETIREPARPGPLEWWRNRRRAEENRVLEGTLETLERGGWTQGQRTNHVGQHCLIGAVGQNAPLWRPGLRHRVYGRLARTEGIERGWENGPLHFITLAGWNDNLRYYGGEQQVKSLIRRTLER